MHKSFRRLVLPFQWLKPVFGSIVSLMSCRAVRHPNTSGLRRFRSLWVISSLGPTGLIIHDGVVDCVTAENISVGRCKISTLGSIVIRWLAARRLYCRAVNSRRRRESEQATTAAGVCLPCRRNQSSRKVEQTLLPSRENNSQP